MQSEKKGVENMLTRREFLQGALAGAAMQPLIKLLASAPRVYAAGERAIPWQEGFEELKTDVFLKPREMLRWYTEGAVTGWRPPRELGIAEDSDEGGKQDEIIAGHIASERPRIVRRAHTHPIAALVHIESVSPNYKADLERKVVRPFLAPPSARDIASIIWIQSGFFKTHSISFEDLVFDASGLWTMRLTSGMFSKLLFEAQSLHKNIIPAAIARASLPALDKQTLLNCLETLNLTRAQEIGTPEIVRLFGDYNSVNFSLYQLFTPHLSVYEGLVAQLQKQSPHMNDAERANGIADVIAQAAKLDIKLSFEPYSTP